MVATIWSWSEQCSSSENEAKTHCQSRLPQDLDNLWRIRDEGSKDLNRKTRAERINEFEDSCARWQTQQATCHKQHVGGEGRRGHRQCSTYRATLPNEVHRKCGEEEDVVGALTPVVSGVVQVFHVHLVELRLLLVAEVEEGDRQEEGWEVESGVGRVKEKQPLAWMAWRWCERCKTQLEPWKWVWWSRTVKLCVQAQCMLWCATRSSKSGVSTSSLVFTLLCFLSRLLLLQFISLVSRSHFSHMFSLYPHGILGVVFTLLVGYSRPPSAVNDPTVIKQLNSENHASNKCPNHFFYQVSLINRCWVRLGGDSRKKNATMILASFTKTKNSFALSFIFFVF